jgi:hypothetical protein
LRATLKKWNKIFSNLNKIITNNFTLAMLDGIQEQRTLSIMEKNFRSILKKHIARLLEAKMIYWKNRAKIKRAQLGGENTRFLDMVATQRHRKNYITTITSDDGTLISNHEHKSCY